MLSWVSSLLLTAEVAEETRRSQRDCASLRISASFSAISAVRCGLRAQQTSKHTKLTKGFALLFVFFAGFVSKWTAFGLGADHGIECLASLGERIVLPETEDRLRMGVAMEGEMDGTRRDVMAGGLAMSAVGAAPAKAADKAPPAPPPAIAELVGEYGAPDNILTVYEAGGGLMANGRGLKAVALKPAGKDRYAGAGAELEVARAANGTVSGVFLAHQGLPRRDFGAEVQAKIRAGVHAEAAATLRAQALAATPPKEPPPARPADLVDLTTVDPAIKLDIRYAGANNFMGFPLYERAAAYMQRPAAEAVGRALKRLKPQGFGLLIHDAYRPWFVTKMFWEATPPEGRIFVADPAQGSRHNRGCAVDLTLYTLSDGKPVEMTGRYDEMSQRSYPDYVGGTSRQRWRRQVLRTAMEAEGFSVYPQEWWHFDYKDWAQYGIGTATFTELAGR